MIQKRIVAFDIGDRRVGIAITDPFGSYAIPCDTYFRTGDFQKDVQFLCDFVVREGAGALVCGLPLNADGTESIQTEKTRRMIRALKERLTVPVFEEDERYTTMQARRDLVSVGVSTKKDKQKKNIDSIAASYILETYLANSKKGDNNMSLKEENTVYEEDDNVAILIDEDGNKLRFEHLGTIEYKGEWYAFFTPEKTEEEYDEEESEEIAVFHIVGEEDDETLEIVEDEALLEEVFAEYCRLDAEEFEAEEAAMLEPDEEN